MPLYSSNKFTVFLTSLKPWTFPASILSFLLGTALAWRYDGKFRLVNCFLTALVILFTHAAGNFVNSFYEAQNRRFFVSSATRRVTLELSTWWAIWSYVLASAAFGCLAVVSKAEFRQEFGLFATGFLASLLHGGGLKNIVLGDVLTCGIFGPLSILFTYIEQVGTIHRQLSYDWMALYSLPLMLFTEAIFHRYETIFQFIYHIFYSCHSHNYNRLLVVFTFVSCLSIVFVYFMKTGVCPDLIDIDNIYRVYMELRQRSFELNG